VHHVHSPYFKTSTKSYTVKTTKGNIGGKKTTTVQKADSGAEVKSRSTTVQKKSESNAGQKSTTVNNKETKTKSTKTKRPGGVKPDKTTKKSSTGGRKGRR
jgi:hypothetical protein